MLVHNIILNSDISGINFIIIPLVLCTCIRGWVDALTILLFHQDQQYFLSILFHNYIWLYKIITFLDSHGIDLMLFQSHLHY